MRRKAQCRASRRSPRPQLTHGLENAVCCTNVSVLFRAAMRAGDAHVRTLTFVMSAVRRLNAQKSALLGVARQPTDREVHPRCCRGLGAAVDRNFTDCMLLSEDGQFATSAVSRHTINA